MDTRTQAVVQEIVNQRDAYANMCANLRGEIAVLQERIAALGKSEVQTVSVDEGYQSGGNG